jgi:hypothetical protein
MISTRQSLAWLILALVLDARFAHAAMTDSAGDCPRSVEVDAALAQLLSAKSGRTSSAAVTVRDLGTSWTVQVAGRSATYSDPDRNCPERTKIAAVFAALVLEPPDLGEPSPAPPTRESTSPTQARLPRTYRLDLAPEFLVAPGAGERSSALTWGGSLRGRASGEHFGLAAGVQASYPAVAKVQTFEMSLARVSLDTSATLSWRLAAAEFGIEIGPYGALLLAHGRGLYLNGSSTHIDAGGRLGFRAQTIGRWVSPFLALQAEVSARHFSLMVEPIGDVGTAPRVWLGVLAGASISLGHSDGNPGRVPIPFGPPPATPPRSLRSASRDGAPRAALAEPAGSPRED